MRTPKNVPKPTTIELADETNLQYLAFIEHQGDQYITIIDNIVDDIVTAFVIDRLEAEGIDRNWFISVANLWYYESSGTYPLSVEFAKYDQTELIRAVIKRFDMSQVTKIVGRIFKYDTTFKSKVKKRRASYAQAIKSVRLKDTK